MNLRKISKAKKSPQAGDIFIFTLDRTEYMFGMIVTTKARIGPMEECVLIYIYSHATKDPSKVPELLKHDLLVPPMMTNKRPWTMGYFKTITHTNISHADTFPAHCFKSSRGRYYDEWGHQIKPNLKIPCGEWGLQSYRTIDDTISKALGLQLSKD